VKHAAILLAEQLARRCERGGAEISAEDALALTRALHRDFGESCHWSKQYPADDDGCRRLCAEALDLLEGFGLVSSTASGWRVRPAVARFPPRSPGAPPRREVR